ncbi:MAG: transposase [Hyphomicrobiaceae bacterium]|nr:transposase [Hyphomicrobiaceae bacterium]
MSDRFDQSTLKTKQPEPGDGGEAGATPVCRIELITGAGRRRRWSGDDKARIIVESSRPGANVSEVARRHGLSPQQLFGWRREARAIMAEPADAAPEPGQSAPAAARARNGASRPSTGECSSAERVPAFTPVVVAPCAASPVAPRSGRRGSRRAGPAHPASAWRMTYRIFRTSD